MNFNSGAFLIFLPVVVGLYWLLPHKARKYALLAASWFFYMYWNPLLILLLLASTAVDYFCGLGMERWPEEKGRKKALLLCSMCMNLGMLFFFKYWDFFGDMASGLFAALGITYHVPSLNLILPVGISFYTFQTMSYTIDVYRGKFKSERDPVYFALFVSYFPQLVAGPIEKPGDLLPQLKAEHRWKQDDFTAGLRLMLCGFFRKCVVADQCGIYVNAVFSHMESANALAVAGAGALFCIQMYCDFAGYSEIAAGCARLMGVRLTRNFDRPYLAQSYTEFFRRWHISLNRWFTQYLYIPLGGNRRGTLIKIRNTVIVFALCGLWHGANWTYVLWGLYAAVGTSAMLSLSEDALREGDVVVLAVEPTADTLSTYFGATAFLKRGEGQGPDRPSEPRAKAAGDRELSALHPGKVRHRAVGPSAPGRGRLRQSRL